MTKENYFLAVPNLLLLIFELHWLSLNFVFGLGDRRLLKQPFRCNFTPISRLLPGKITKIHSSSFRGVLLMQRLLSRSFWYLLDLIFQPYYTVCSPHFLPSFGLAFVFSFSNFAKTQSLLFSSFFKRSKKTLH